MQNLKHIENTFTVLNFMGLRQFKFTINKKMFEYLLAREADTQTFFYFRPFAIALGDRLSFKADSAVGSIESVPREADCLGELDSVPL